MGWVKNWISKKLLSNFLDFYFPRYCPGCSKPIKDDWICKDCLANILPLEPCCPSCGYPYPAEDISHLCEACQKKPPPFSRIWIPFRYQGLIRKIIHRFKYKGELWLLKPLASLWKKETKLENNIFDYVIPIPLHKKRLHERGFNQSLLLAQEIFGFSQTYNILLRKRDTLPQVGLNISEREKNIKEAFKIKDNFSLLDKKVLLFDDVMTTGATLKEGAQILKKAGAKEVHIAALARTG